MEAYKEFIHFCLWAFTYFSRLHDTGEWLNFQRERRIPAQLFRRLVFPILPPHLSFPPGPPLAPSLPFYSWFLPSLPKTAASSRLEQLMRGSQRGYQCPLLGTSALRRPEERDGWVRLLHPERSASSVIPQLPRIQLTFSYAFPCAQHLSLHCNMTSCNSVFLLCCNSLSYIWLLNKSYLRDYMVKHLVSSVMEFDGALKSRRNQEKPEVHQLKHWFESCPRVPFALFKTFSLKQPLGHLLFASSWRGAWCTEESGNLNLSSRGFIPAAGLIYTANKESAHREVPTDAPLDHKGAARCFPHQGFQGRCWDQVAHALTLRS